MPDDPKTTTESLEPVHVTIIGTGDGGALPASGSTAFTPGKHEPNLVVRVIGPVMAILVRFVNQFLTTLVGLVGAAMTPAGAHLIPTTDFLDLVMSCAVLSVAGAGFGLLKDCVTIVGRLEQRWPLLSGSV